MKLPAFLDIFTLRYENKRLREKLRRYKQHLRAANKGAETNAKSAQLSALRNSLLLKELTVLKRKLREIETK